MSIRTVDLADWLEQAGYKDYFSADALDQICGWYDDRYQDIFFPDELIEEWKEYRSDEYVEDLNDVILDEWQGYVDGSYFDEYDEDDAVLAIKDAIEEDDGHFAYIPSGIIIKVPDSWQ